MNKTQYPICLRSYGLDQIYFIPNNKTIKFHAQNGTLIFYISYSNSFDLLFYFILKNNNKNKEYFISDYNFYHYLNVNFY